MHKGYGSHLYDILCVCLSVTALATYLVYMLKMRCHRVLCGFFKDLYHVAFGGNALFKSSDADHHCLPRSLSSSRWTKGTVMASFLFNANSRYI